MFAWRRAEEQNLSIDEWKWWGLPRCCWRGWGRFLEHFLFKLFVNPIDPGSVVLVDLCSTALDLSERAFENFASELLSLAWLLA